MIHVKICGITSFNDAIMATNYGASALGFIFYEKSPRYINPEILKTWISNVPSSIKKVGVFVKLIVDEARIAWKNKEKKAAKRKRAKAKAARDQ